MALLLFAGIRPSEADVEINRLDWSAVGAREIYISEETSKTKRDRQLPIAARLRRGWIRTILRKRRGRQGQGRGLDRQRWTNRSFTKLGLFCLVDARKTEFASFRTGANYRLESRMRKIRPSGSERGAGQDPVPTSIPYRRPTATA